MADRHTDRQTGKRVDMRQETKKQKSSNISGLSRDRKKREDERKKEKNEESRKPESRLKSVQHCDCVTAVCQH